jgi:hypothetical protein
MGVLEAGVILEMILRKKPIRLCNWFKVMATDWASEMIVMDFWFRNKECLGYLLI